MPKSDDDKDKIPMGCLGDLGDKDLSWIFVGDKDDARNIQVLRSHNIKYILNCTPPRSNGGVPNYHEKDPNIQYCRLEMLDNGTEKLGKWFEPAWEFFERARVREDGGILVHCNMGVSRSTSMVCAYLMKHYQKGADECLDLCQKCRECCNPIEAFKEELRAFGKKLEETKDYAKGVLKRKVAPGGLSSGPAKKKTAVGPARGPTAGPTVGPSVGPVRPNVGPSVGPAGPPTKGPAVGPSVGPAGPPTKGPAVGPSIGPSGPPTNGPSVGPSIGPAGPESSDKKDKKDKKEKKEKKEKGSIGPSIGPSAGPGRP